jgi:hypothetical protein
MFLLAWFAAVGSAAPIQLTHSGRLLGADGNPIDGAVALELRLLDETGVGSLWFEIVNLNTEAGYYQVTLGSDVGENPLDSALFTGAPRFLQISRVPGGPIGAPTPITAVPEAAHATSVSGGLVRVGTGSATCDGYPEGAIRYTSSGGFEGCKPTGWVSLEGGTSGALGSQSNPGQHCQQLYSLGNTTSGLYWLTATVGGTAYPTYCHMGDGGGWTLILKGNTNNSNNPLAWYDHAWWSSFAGIGAPDDGIFAVENAEHFTWSSMLLRSGTSSVQLNGTSSSFALGGHGDLTVSNNNGSAVGNGTVMSKNAYRTSGNNLVERQGRWLTGSCDGTECHGTHGFGVRGQNHHGGWYAQASSMFQTYSYGGGTPETLWVYVR